MALTEDDRARLKREMDHIQKQENQRSRQLKNVREAIKTLQDRLGTEAGGVFDGKDPDKCLWFIAMFEEVLDLYLVGTAADTCQLLEVDACSILTGCLGGNAQEVLRATKVTDKGLHRNLERLKETIITKFMGDLTQFDLKAKAWASKQKEGECVRDWAARLRLLMFYYMKKEILDSAKYKQQLVRGKYANSFSGEDLTHYDWATTDYWRQMLIYINDESVTPPWHAACWERYEITPEYARTKGRSMARCEGGPN